MNKKSISPAPHHRLLRLCSALALASPLPGLAQQVLQPVVVQGSPIVEATRSDLFAALSTEVGETQIRELNALDLSSALRRTPGVAISRFNPVGAFGGDEGGAVYVRGLGASRPGSEIKTYVDGIPLYMGVWNHSLLDLLPVHGMSRVTVHKGPQPQRFGNSFAAIDLTPREAKLPGASAEILASAGSFSTVVEQASLSWRQGDSALLLSQGAARSNGHREQADGRLANLMLNASQRLAPQWTLGLLLLGADNEVGDPGTQGEPASAGSRYASRAGLATLSLAHAHEQAQGRLQLYSNRGTGDLTPTSGARTRSRFQLSGLRWREQWQPWEGAELDAGWDLDRMSGSVAFGDFTAFDGLSLRLSSPHLAFAQRLSLTEGWQAVPSIGLRSDSHNVFGQHLAPHAGLILEHGALALRLNQSRGLNHPGLDAALLNAIVPPLAGASPQGWRQLRPEQMDHRELGLHWAGSPGSQLDVALFHDQLRQRYVFAFPPAVSMPSFTNLGDYRVQGLEASWQQHWNAQWSSFAGLTLLDASLADLPYAPRRALTLGLTWRHGPWRVSADAQAQARMFVLNKARADGSANSAQVAGFGVVNLRVAHALAALGPQAEAFLALENLGGARYAYRPGYPMPGRSAQLGLSFKL